MEEEADSFSSRESARGFRTKVANLMDMANDRVIALDFSNVPVISSSFADEVFGRLFSELGPVRFMRYVKLHNTSELVGSLIDRAIVQRAGE